MTTSNDPSKTDELNEKSSVSHASVAIGCIVSVTGSQAIIKLKDPASIGLEHCYRPEMGTLLRIETPRSVVLGLVSALSIPVPVHNEEDTEIRVAELELVGEFSKDQDGNAQAFRRGVTAYPALGDDAFVTSRDELEKTYLQDEDIAVTVGTISQDSSIPAMLSIDELLGKHFSILGTTGTGKSCTVALIFRAILMKNPHAHVLLLDPHNEYASSFKDMAEVITPHDLNLPFWLLTFEEIVEIFLGDKKGKTAEIEILSELIPVAKNLYSVGRDASSRSVILNQSSETSNFSVNTPQPYRISDLIGLIEDRMGRLEYKNDVWSHKQLKARIEALSRDSRFSFMFGSLTVQDTMADVIGRLFRIPVNNKPIAILELNGLPSEVISVVVSVIFRMAFDFALWSEGAIPITLVCEEAHRYIPTDTNLGFEPARRSIARIAKEGRKYGVSLCIVSQRPSELDPTILSQCNTVFAMRMSNDHDQRIVRAAVADSATGLLDFLPSLGQREAIVFGDGVTLPARIGLANLPEEAMPKSETARFTKRWQQEISNDQFLGEVISRWRAAGSHKGLHGTEELSANAQSTAQNPSLRKAAVNAPQQMQSNIAQHYNK